MKWANRLLLFGVMLWVQSMEVSFSPNKSSLITGLNLGLAKVGAEEMTPGERANRDFQDQLNKKDLLEVLRQGGYVIYIRHGQTEKDYADQVTAEMGNCATQRTLSEVGWQQAKAIGEAFKKYAIPYDQVFSSQYCRAWQTADLAFGRYKKNADLNFPKAEDYSPEQIAQMKALLMPFLTQIPSPGTNNIVVGHDDPFEAATGIYPDPQGMAYVVKPLGGDRFTLVANVRAEEWLELGQ
ncbi:histidine phosphatase family protein [Synechocystis salina LEGE 06099]|uniref:histidine phosphatase family protein n=1 Tax=Synechocystis salina TaxID=945780 RepID=UPI00187E9D70|nr:histidine phosphatase family protein [Synechocystis salina]MBE9203297.1 histidine phosphatase family protein [Synechocystis salina LEGE 06099]